MPIWEPRLVRPKVAAETCRHQNIAPIHLGDLERSTELCQRSITQLENRKSDALKTLRILVDPEWEVVSALGHEELRYGLAIGPEEQSIEATLGLRTQ